MRYLKLLIGSKHDIKILIFIAFRSNAMMLAKDKDWSSSCILCVFLIGEGSCYMRDSILTVISNYFILYTVNF
jgi:hypothetical protein